LGECFFQGCSAELRPEGLPELHPATLIFTQEGKPLEGATIMLSSPDVGWVVGGVTDANGRAVLHTHQKFRGAPAGEYKVSVEKLETEGEQASPSNPWAVWKIFNLVEQQYWYPYTTPLTVTIVEGTNTPPPFDVGKAVRLEPPSAL